jgi:hypothetical protein
VLEKRAQRVPAFSTWIKLIMKVIKSYSTRVDADLAKIALDAAGVPSVVVGVGLAMEGGAGGVQLLVPEEYVDAALKVLERS